MIRTFGTLALLAVAGNGSLAEAQALTYTPRNVTTPDPIGKIAVTNAVCHAEDGSVSADGVLSSNGNYVKAGVGIEIQAHTSTFVTGVCEWYIFGQHYPQFDETRYISVVGFTDIHPSPQTSGYMTTTNYSSSQTLDTENPQKSTQLSITGIEVPGEHEFKFQTHALSTSCLIPTTSAFVQRTVNAVACLPQWLKDDNGDLLPRGRFPVDGEPIKVIYSDNGNATAVAAVVAAWNTELHNAGLTGLTFQDAGNVSCDDGHCIRVGSSAFTNVTCSTGACGCSQSGTITTGEYTTRANVTMVADWNDDFKQWVLSHEIGHLLGLGENNQCASGTTAMAAASCNSTPAVIGAKPSDAVPVAKTVYGNAGTKTCGW